MSYLSFFVNSEKISIRIDRRKKNFVKKKKIHENSLLRKKRLTCSNFSVTRIYPNEDEIGSKFSWTDSSAGRAADS